MTGLFAEPDQEPRRRLGERGPWWVEALGVFLDRFGIPTVLLVIFGGWMLWMSTGYVKVMAKNVEDTKVAVQQHQEQMVRDALDAKEGREREIAILTIMCEMAAESRKSDAMRFACSGKR